MSEEKPIWTYPGANRNVSLYVAGNLIKHLNAGTPWSIKANGDDGFKVYERYGATLDGGYGQSEIPIDSGTVAEFCTKNSS